MNKVLIKDIMSSNIFYIDINDSIEKAEALMTEENSRHIPVVENNKLVGILTHKKIIEYKLRELYDNTEGESAYDVKILDFEKLIKRDPTVIYPEDSLKKVVEIMIKKEIDYIPVVDWDKNLLGSISFIDILLFVNSMLEKGVI
jgi:predicted transcriptional regulator